MSETATYAPAGPASTAFQHMRLCAASFSETIDALRETIEAADFRVLAEIDPHALLGSAGLAICATRQILFFHPRFLADVLGVDQAALLEAPLKFAVLERPSGSVVIRWHDPAPVFARYRDARLAALGQQLAATCAAIADAAVASLISLRSAWDEGSFHATPHRSLAQVQA